MHYSFLLSALAGLSLAAASPLLVRQANSTCVATQTGTAPPTHPDTPQAFQNNLVYQGLAVAASVIPPSGYETTFRNAAGATQGGGYLGYIYLNAYDPSQCATVCNAIAGCSSINTYVERDPSTTPAAGCLNPPGVANFKCSFWSTYIDSSNATNYGQFQDQFAVVIAGSDGFVKC
ncbi:MAG: hypothetical protein LQ340_002271 [Diploschistes diacapsis]|nr:MAG: hypothetical protein LQ340_002271 [Diploschistes diacapsis]